MRKARSIVTCVVVAGTIAAIPGRVAAQCAAEGARQVARAVKLACTAHDRAARRGGAADLSRVDRVQVGPLCVGAAKALCHDVADLCYGAAFDATAASFPTAILDPCARKIGVLCTRALAKEIQAPGAGVLLLGRLARSCGDPITGTLGGACDGVTANAAAQSCLTAQLSSMAAGIAPPTPTPTATPTPVLPPPRPFDCGFPGRVVKPVVPGGEFDATLSPWRQTIPAGQSYEPLTANNSQMAYVAPSGPGRTVMSVREWTYPVYNIVANAATDCPSSMQSRCFDQVTIEDVYLTQNWNPTGRAIRHVPVPTGIAVRPDPQADSHMAIVDWVHGIEYDFWACLKYADGTWKRVAWPTSQGGDGQPRLACQAGGKLYLRGTGINLIGPDTAKGSGLALSAGLVRPEELATGGSIAHALHLTITAPATGGPIPPANTSDGVGPAYPAAPPEGARLQLRPNIWTDAVIDAQTWTDAEKKIARALRDYGAIIGDKGGSGSDVDLYAESPVYHPTMYDTIPGIDLAPATILFDQTFFTATNFQILLEPAQHGNNDDGSRDLDGDGMFDSFEIANGWFDRFETGSPANASDDPDGDGLTNLQEQRCLHATWPEYLASWPGFASNPPFQYPCNPYDADTDHDSFDDAVERVAGTDPTDPCSHP